MERRELIQELRDTIKEMIQTETAEYIQHMMDDGDQNNQSLQGHRFDNYEREQLDW